MIGLCKTLLDLGYIYWMNKEKIHDIMIKSYSDSSVFVDSDVCFMILLYTVLIWQKILITTKFSVQSPFLINPEYLSITLEKNFH
ncbi:hypothetical protein BpHYR1_031516 [Brachionus plicatilis]|uniref:Uncharacterized protein n=1 Tax=Brachionus plicatilis TaxID=10195 RepID=A0A3M7T207_BRAPC|nr:hypothetical protein BpHYR1_031516 [Brachionus plicatilis]